MKKLDYLFPCLAVLTLLLLFNCQTEEGKEELSSEKSITAFSFNITENPGLSVTVAAFINGDNIVCTVPVNTDVTSLKPTIVFKGASIDPSSGTAQDFTHPVNYTVTAADGSTRSYLLTVFIAQGPLSPDNSIILFSFLKTDNASLSSDIEATMSGQTILAQVPQEVSLTSLKPSIVHDGVSISPGNGTTVDFTLPVTYTVTAEDGATQEFLVKVTHYSEEVPAVYVVGNETFSGTSYVRVWKNGTGTSLTDGTYNSFGKSIAVHGNTWHVAGHQAIGSTYATHWKMENEILLPTPGLNETKNDATANSIFVTESGDVYIAGVENDNIYSAAKVWKNGTPTHLSTKIVSYAWSVFVSGTDVYVAGVEPAVKEGMAARLWKNGVATSLSPDIANSDAGAVFESGGIVYVGGVVYMNNLAIPTIWRDEVADLNTPGAEGCRVKSIFVSDGVVYRAGSQIRDKQTNACIWKDHTITFLSDVPNSEASSIFVYEGDVYVAGHENNGDGISTAVLWKNGAPTVLGTHAFATGVVVK